MLIKASVQKRVLVTISGGTVYVGSFLDIAGSLTVNMTSAIVSQPGIYTLFDTVSGIRVDSSLQSAGADLDGKIIVIVPDGYGVQSVYVDEAGKDVKVEIRTVATA
jgi:hypothetical protein